METGVGQDYASFSPRELNQELCKLYALLPPEVPEHQEEDQINRQDVFDTYERRERSELKKLVLNRLKSLLIYARITETFKIFLLDDFLQSWTVGVIKQAGAQPDPYNVFRQDSIDAESNGIFDDDLAKHIEKRFYSLQIKEYLENNKLRERYFGLERRHPGRVGLWLQRWRVEFIEKYGEEP